MISGDKDTMLNKILSDNTKRSFYQIWYDFKFYVRQSWTFNFQVSAETCIIGDEEYYIGFVKNLVFFLAVKKFLKSVKIWQSCRSFLFRDTV